LCNCVAPLFVFCWLNIWDVVLVLGFLLVDIFHSRLVDGPNSAILFGLQRLKFLHLTRVARAGALSSVLVQFAAPILRTLFALTFLLALAEHVLGIVSFKLLTLSFALGPHGEFVEHKLRASFCSRRRGW